MIYHVIKPNTLSTLTYCGRRVGTPGGKVYPGVHAEHPRWFWEHRFPDAIVGHTCRSCARGLLRWLEAEVEVTRRAGALLDDAAKALDKWKPQS